MHIRTVANIAKRLNFRAGAFSLPPLIYFTDEIRMADPSDSIVRLPAGSGVVFRHYGARGRRALALIIKDLCKKKGLDFIIAGDVRLANDLDADGLHLPEYLSASLPLDVRIWKNNPRKYVTGAAHSYRALRNCQKFGLNAAFLSPVFSSVSHPRGRTLGPLQLQYLCRISSIPVYALGGINNANASSLIHSGTIGIAGIGGIIDNG